MNIISYLWPAITGTCGMYLATRYILDVQRHGLTEINRKILQVVFLFSISLFLACLSFVIDGPPSIKDGLIPFAVTLLAGIDGYFVYRILSTFKWKLTLPISQRLLKSIDSVVYFAVFLNIYFLLFDEKKIFLSLTCLFSLDFIIVLVFLRIISGRKMFAKGVKMTRTFKGVSQDFLRMLVLVFLIIEAYAKVYIVTGISSSGKTIVDLPTAMYFSVITWTTVGYGDIVPEGYSRLMSASEAVNGVITMGLLIAALTTIAQIDLKSLPE